MTTVRDPETGGLGALAQRPRDKWKESPWIRKGGELEFRKDTTGTVATAVSPSTGFANCHIESFLCEIPPGWKTGSQRHNFETIMLILEGKGYTSIDGRRYEWKAGDIISIPPMSNHQHFNPDPSNRVRFTAVTTRPLMDNIGSLNVEATGEAGRIE